MASPLLSSLLPHLEDDVDGVRAEGDGLRAIVDGRFGEVTVAIDYDEEAAGLRVSTELPPPAGAGPDFLVWCLSTNVTYWDVKIGLGESGMLVIHADLEADEAADPKEVATDVIDRVESMMQLLDEDLADHLLAAGLGTPAQRARWAKRAPGAEGAEP